MFKQSKDVNKITICIIIQYINEYIHMHAHKHTHTHRCLDNMTDTTEQKIDTEGGRVSANFNIMMFFQKIKHLYILFLTFQVPFHKGCFQGFSRT